MKTAINTINQLIVSVVTSIAWLIDSITEKLINLKAYLKDEKNKAEIVENLAKLVAILVAISSGITAAVSCATTAFFASWGLPFFILVGLAGITVNIFIYWQSVQKAFKKLFIKGIFKGLDDSLSKKLLISSGLFCSIAWGFALAAINYTSVALLVGNIAALLGTSAVVAASPWLIIPIAGLLAAIIFFANASLMFTSISKIIKKNGHLKILSFFYDLFKRRDDQTRLQYFIETASKVLFLFAGIGAAIIATTTTLGALWKSLGLVIGKIFPHAAETACRIASAIIVMGFAALARLPFAIEKSCTVFSAIGGMVGWIIAYPKQAWQAAKHRSRQAYDFILKECDNSEDTVEVIAVGLEYIGLSLLLGGAVALNAIGHGAISEKGGYVLDSILGNEGHASYTGSVAMITSGIMSGVVGAERTQNALKEQFKEIFPSAEGFEQPITASHSSGMQLSTST